MTDTCTDCGTSLVGLRPRLKVSGEPVCGSCAGRRMGWGDLPADVESRCRDADADYILKEEA